MNTKNNKRRRESCNKIEVTFIQLLQTNEIEDISVTDICKLAHINRSTFYANYIDIYDLVEKIRDRILTNFEELYNDELEKKYNSNDFLKLFYHIKDNQLFYKTYFKLQFDLNVKFEKYDTLLAQLKFGDKEHKYIRYHMEFFKGGITSIIKMWLDEGCTISPEDLSNVIKDEYKNIFL